MHSMAKRRLALVVAALLVIASLTLAGCGQDRGAEETTSETTGSTEGN